MYLAEYRKRKTAPDHGEIPRVDDARRGDPAIKNVDNLALMVAQHGHPGRQDLNVRVKKVSRCIPHPRLTR